MMMMMMMMMMMNLYHNNSHTNINIESDNDYVNSFSCYWDNEKKRKEEENFLRLPYIVVHCFSKEKWYMSNPSEETCI